MKYTFIIVRNLIFYLIILVPVRHVHATKLLIDGSIPKDTITRTSNSDKSDPHSEIPSGKNKELSTSYFSFGDLDKEIESNKIRNINSIDFSEEDDLAGSIKNTNVDYAGNPAVKRADSAFAVLHESKLIDKLTGMELVELPVGLQKTFGGNTYTVLINRVILRPEYAQLEVFCKIKLSDGRILYFGSDNIKYSSEGGLIGETTLGLFADYAITKESSNMAIFLNGFKRNPDGIHDGCYVTIDCEGFVEMRVDATLHLSRKWVLPADQDGNPLPGNERVKSHFALTVMNWDDLLIEASMPSFVLTKAPDVAFILSGIVIDMSESRNAAGFMPPPDFEYLNMNPDGSVSTVGAEVSSLPDPDGHTDRENNNTSNNNSSSGNPGAETWKGVFIQHLEIILPKEFNNRKDNDRFSFGAQNLYIDSRGVTGSFFAENIISMGKVKAGKWDMSLDILVVDVVYNQVIKFRFEGGLVLPVTALEKPLIYRGSANLQKRHYHFGVELGQETSFPLFKTGKVTLHPSCKLDIHLKEGKFTAAAMLSGVFGSEAEDEQEQEKALIKLPTVRFTKLLIQSEAPYLTLSSHGGALTLEDGGFLNNAYINVSHAHLVIPEPGKIMLSLTMESDLMSDADGGGKTGGTFGIRARLEESEDSQRWVYDGIKLTSLTIDISIGRHVRVNGTINAFSGHPVYGSGFKGSLAGGMIANDGDDPGYKFTLVVNTIFGETSAGQDAPYKYWFFDVFMSAEKWAVPLFAGIEANGFGGGAYHHMKMAGYKPIPGGDVQNPSSGVIYEPDKNVAFGIKASMAIRDNSGSFKGVVTFQMEFGTGLSLQKIMFYGQGEFVSDDLFPGISDRLDKLSQIKEVVDADDLNAAQENQADKITAAVYLELNFLDGFVMQGSFGAFMDASQGRIVGQGNIDLLIDPGKNKWHLYIGGYTDGSVVDSKGKKLPPINATISCGSFNITANVYFLTGNDIPGAPPISQQVAAFFNISTDVNNRDILKTGGRSPATGTGFALGASAFFDINTGDGTCKTADWSAARWWRPWPNFYNNPTFVRVSGGVGFDISLLKYTPQTMCEISRTSPHGVKYWRAGGRLWAYLDIQQGRWRLLGCCAPIPRFSAGILLDGDVPNPSYFRAIVKFSIVGINVNLNAEIGNQCGRVMN